MSESTRKNTLVVLRANCLPLGREPSFLSGSHLEMGLDDVITVRRRVKKARKKLQRRQFSCGLNRRTGLPELKTGLACLLHADPCRRIAT